MNAGNKVDLQKVEQSVSNAADTVADAVRDGGKAAARIVEDGADMAKRQIKHADAALQEAAGTVKETAEEVLDEGRSRLGDVMRKAQDTAVDAKDAIVASAGSTLAAVKDVAVEKADAARETLSDVGDRLAATLQRASAEDGEDALKSRVLSSVAQGLTSASDALRQRSVTDLGSDIRMLAKRHPGAFMAVAAVAGFAAARFVRSSSRRRMNETDGGRGPQV